MILYELEILQEQGQLPYVVVRSETALERRRR